MKQGQTVSLSLLPFDLVTLLDWDDVALDAASCPVTLSVIEGSERTAVDVCDASRQRETEVYAAAGNHVMLELGFRMGERTPHFLIKYKGACVGGRYACNVTV